MTPNIFCGMMKNDRSHLNAIFLDLSALLTNIHTLGCQQDLVVSEGIKVLTNPEADGKHASSLLGWRAQEKQCNNTDVRDGSPEEHICVMFLCVFVIHRRPCHKLPVLLSLFKKIATSSKTMLNIAMKNEQQKTAVKHSSFFPTRRTDNERSAAKCAKMPHANSQRPRTFFLKKKT